MNKLLIWALSVTTIFSIVGCSVDKDFSFTLEKEFSATNYQNATYSTSATMDAKQSSSDFDKYRSDLKSLDIESGSYTITYFQGSATQTIESGTISVSDVNGGAQHTIATISNVNLMAVAGQTQPLTLDDAGKQFFKDQLLSSASAATVYLTATTNQTPITFTIKLSFKVKASYSKSIL